MKLAAMRNEEIRKLHDNALGQYEDFKALKLNLLIPMEMIAGTTAFGMAFPK